MAKTVKVTAKVQTPNVPNFFRCEDGGLIPIEAIKEDGLREIGLAFTRELIEKAREKRALKG